MPELTPINSRSITIANPHHPHLNPDEVTAIQVTEERLTNGEIPGIVIENGFPYLDIPVEKRGVDEFGGIQTATIIDHHYLETGDFIVTEPGDQPKTYVVDSETFTINYKPIAGQPGHYRSKVSEAVILAHSAHLHDDAPFCGYAFMG